MLQGNDDDYFKILCGSILGAIHMIQTLAMFNAMNHNYAEYLQLDHTHVCYG